MKIKSICCIISADEARASHAAAELGAQSGVDALGDGLAKPRFLGESNFKSVMERAVAAMLLDKKEPVRGVPSLGDDAGSVSRETARLLECLQDPALQRQGSCIHVIGDLTEPVVAALKNGRHACQPWSTPDGRQGFVITAPSPTTNRSHGRSA